MSAQRLPAIDDVLESMHRHLKEHPGLCDVAEHRNGFEGWLKFEFASVLRSYGSRPWISAPVGKLSHGVEYRYKRAAFRNEPEASKLIDLWLAVKEEVSWDAPNPTLYFELKTAFYNPNAGKQLRSWSADFAKLEAVLAGDSSAVGFAAVLVAVGFDDEKMWKRDVAEVSGQATLRDYGAVVHGLDIGTVRMLALRHSRGTM